MTDAADRFPMSRRGKVIVGGGTVAAGALALMVAFTAPHEGEVRRTYVDMLGKGHPLSYCYGETAGAVAGKTYTHSECLEALRVSAMDHAQDVAKCLPAGLPDSTAAAFYDFGYNAGAPTFCRSSMARKAKVDDLRGACAALSLYVFTNGKDCRIAANRCGGIVRRRMAERELCLEGLR
jgi:lysozyme